MQQIRIYYSVIYFTDAMTHLIQKMFHGIKIFFFFRFCKLIFILKIY